MGREVCLTIPYVLSSTRIKDQPIGRQVCLTIPFQKYYIVGENAKSISVCGLISMLKPGLSGTK